MQCCFKFDENALGINCSFIPVECHFCEQNYNCKYVLEGGVMSSNNRTVTQPCYSNSVQHSCTGLFLSS